MGQIRSLPLKNALEKDRDELEKRNTSTLDLQGIAIDEQDARTLGALLRTHSVLRLQWVQLGSCSLTPSALRHITRAVSTTELATSVTRLDLSTQGSIPEGNPLGVDGSTSIAIFIQKCINLQHLKAANCQLECNGMKNIATAISRTKSLKTLDLSYNNISDIGCKELGFSLSRNKSLQGLSLWRNRINGEGAKHLADGLRNNSNLKWLGLGCNAIGDSGLNALMEALIDNITQCKLTWIALGSNQISDAGMEKLAEFLTAGWTSIDEDEGEEGVACPVTSLGLGGNNIGDQGAKEIAQALDVNDKLISLGLSQNKIGNEGARALAEMLQNNRTLENLSLSGNQINNDGGEPLIASLCHNTTLSKLLLAQNPIDDAVCTRCIEVFSQRNLTLQVLDLNDTKISPDALKSFMTHLAQSKNKLQSSTLGDQILTMSEKDHRASSRISGNPLEVASWRPPPASEVPQRDIFKVSDRTRNLFSFPGMIVPHEDHDEDNVSSGSSIDLDMFSGNLVDEGEGEGEIAGKELEIKLVTSKRNTWRQSRLFEESLELEPPSNTFVDGSDDESHNDNTLVDLSAVNEATLIDEEEKEEKTTNNEPPSPQTVPSETETKVTQQSDTDESNTDTQTNELKTETQTNELKTDTQTNELKTDTQTNELKTETQTNTHTEESKTETQTNHQQSDTHTDESDIHTDEPQTQTNHQQSDTHTDETDIHTDEPQTQTTPPQQRPLAQVTSPQHKVPQSTPTFGYVKKEHIYDEIPSSYRNKQVNLDISTGRASYIRSSNNSSRLIEEKEEEEKEEVEKEKEIEMVKEDDMMKEKEKREEEVKEKKVKKVKGKKKVKKEKKEKEDEEDPLYDSIGREPILPSATKERPRPPPGRRHPSISPSHSMGQLSDESIEPFYVNLSPHSLPGDLSDSEGEIESDKNSFMSASLDLSKKPLKEKWEIGLKQRSGVIKMGGFLQGGYNELMEHVKTIEYNNFMAELACNEKKNRTGGPLAPSHTRVKLQRVMEDLGSDYINASFVGSPSYPRSYIIAQWPMELTVPTFWRMIWEVNAGVVVVLGTSDEGNFWPKKDDYQLHPAISVGEWSHDSLFVRTDKESPTNVEGLTEVAMVIHSYDDEITERLTLYHYTSWPHKGVPQSAHHIGYLFHKSLGARTRGPLVIVSCYGGGRAGCYGAISVAYELLKVPEEPNPFDEDKHILDSVFRGLLSQRSGLVANQRQYDFCHRILEECLWGVASRGEEETDSSKSKGARLLNVFKKKKKNVTS